MRIFKLFLITAAAALAGGCAAFTSGDIRETAKAMLEDRAVTPFADIQLTWKLYPYHAPSEDIGQGYIAQDTGQFKSPVQKPVPADPDDQAKLLKRARSVFA